MSPISVPLLVPILFLEVTRHFWISQEKWTWSVSKRLGRALFLLVSAGATEWFVIRPYYHRYAAAHYGWDHRTFFRGEPGRFKENLAHLMPYLTGGGFWFLLVLASLAPVFLLASLWRSQRKGPTDSTLSTEAWFLATGAALVAYGNLAICTVVSHVRNNGYNERYLGPTHLFLGVASAMVLFGIGTEVVRSLKAQRALLLAFSASLFGLWLARLPPPMGDPHYQELLGLAKNIGTGSNNRVLLGEYWLVYPLAALTRARAVTPLEPDFEEDPRTPFNTSALQVGTEVIVMHGDPKLGSPDAPLAQLAQHGMKLHLIEGRAWVSAGLVLSRYRATGPMATRAGGGK